MAAYPEYSPQEISVHYHNWLTLSAVGYAETVPTVANSAIKAVDPLTIIIIMILYIAYYSITID